MKKIKKRGFTLIELIVVLVILAIVALIVTPLVLNIIDKAKDSANKRSIDEYGKAIELAMQSYKLEHGKFTYDVNDLNIEYSGNKVECDEITLNENGSVFITKCKIDGEYVEDEKTSDGYYQYGGVIFDYSVGDQITYNGIDFYVISNSRKSDKYITLIKSLPITSKEARQIADSTEIGDKLFLGNNYLYMQYFYHDQCVSAGETSGCTTDYSISSVKQIVDAWSNYYLNQSDLLEDELGYKARLITFEELTGDLGYKKTMGGGTYYYISDEDVTPSIIASSGEQTFTMTTYEDYNSKLWYLGSDGSVYSSDVNINSFVKPVVNLRKSAIEE